MQAKTANQRADFLHRLSTQLVSEHEGICLEDLSVRGLPKTKLAKSILDVLGRIPPADGIQDGLEPQASGDGGPLPPVQQDTEPVRMGSLSSSGEKRMTAA
jgi:hypothetical protein